ncbi:MAG: phage portal protein [Algicola sp.]|nr:phage portal protein [Algicola sp.]
MTEKATDKIESSVEMFTFGETEIVDGGITDYLSVYQTGYEHKYYNPPISRDRLANLADCNAHHSSALGFKRNAIKKHYDDTNKVLTLDELGLSALDYVTFGDCFFQVFHNAFGHILRLASLPAISMRVGVIPGTYVKLEKGKEIIFQPGEVIHIKEDDVKQRIYGKPGYIGCVRDIILNKEATSFRIKYYINGAHMGYVFLSTDPNIDDEDKKHLKAQIKASKGVGNGSSMFVHVPDGDKDCIKIIPVGDAPQKDDFKDIKTISMEAILAGHRVQPALAGIMPQNTTGFGDIEKIQKIWWENETVPLQQKMLQLNQYLPKALHVKFIEPAFALEAAKTA